MTDRIVDGWGLNSCGLDATIPFSTVARRWQRLARRERAIGRRGHSLQRLFEGVAGWSLHDLLPTKRPAFLPAYFLESIYFDEVSILECQKRRSGS